MNLKDFFIKPLSVLEEHLPVRNGWLERRESRGKNLDSPGLPVLSRDLGPSWDGEARIVIDSKLEPRCLDISSFFLSPSGLSTIWHNKCQ